MRMPARGWGCQLSLHRSSVLDVLAWSSPTCKWCMSDKNKDRFFSDTRSCTNGARYIVGAVSSAWLRALRTSIAEGTHKERSKKHQVSSQERYRSASILPFGVQAAHRWKSKKRWSDRGLQVDDLKAAGALSCSYVIGAHRTGSQRIILAQPWMNHAPSRGCCRALSAVGE